MGGRKVIITGGAGFIGSNTARSFSDDGDHVVVFDDLSRHGTEVNLSWLHKNTNVSFCRGDVRSYDDVKSLFDHHPDAEAVIHLAAQTAVTSSVRDPRVDFEINALGTLNVLEAIKKTKRPPVLIFSSTNKVYGDMESVEVVEESTRYSYADLPRGISEAQPLDFYSPYGCSKGAANQYVRDYSRIYGIPTIVFRQSCIYGDRQFGVEDQGWVAWFMVAAMTGRKLSVFGDGKQVRDLLFIDDLVRAFREALNRETSTVGKVYNIGGGPDNSISIWTEFSPLLQELFDLRLSADFDLWRPGDQKVFISDTGLALDDFGWRPEVGVKEGLSRLHCWIQGNMELFRRLRIIQ